MKAATDVPTADGGWVGSAKIAPAAKDKMAMQEETKGGSEDRLVAQQTEDEVNVDDHVSEDSPAPVDIFESQSESEELEDNSFMSRAAAWSMLTRANTNYTGLDQETTQVSFLKVSELDDHQSSDSESDADVYPLSIHYNARSACLTKCWWFIFVFILIILIIPTDVYLRDIGWKTKAWIGYLADKVIEET